MRTIILAAFVATLAAVTATAGGEAAKKDAERLQGNWTVLRMEEGGKKAPDELLKATVVTIKGDELTVTENGKPVVAFRMKLDPRKKPAEVNLTHLGGDDKDKTEQGIYEFKKDDTVWFCVADIGKKRPTSFETKKDDEHTLVVIKRKK